MKFIEFRASWNLKEGDEIALICEGRLIIKRVDSKIGIWDFKGNNIIPEEEGMECKCICLNDQMYNNYNQDKYIRNNKYVFIIKKANNKFSIYNYEGKEFECGEIDEYKIFRNTILVIQSGQRGVISLNTGNTIVPIQFEKIENKYHSEYTSRFGEIFKVYKNGKYGCYFETVGRVLPAEFDDWNWRPQEDCFNITNNGLYGIYNFKGQEIVPTNFLQHITTKVKIVEKCIDSPQFNKYMKVYMVTSENYQYGLYSENGKNLIPVQYDQIEINEELTGYPFVVKTGQLYGLYGLEGEKLLEDKYDKISTLELIGQYKWSARFLLLKNNELFGLYLIDNNKLIEPEYDEVKWNSEYGLFVRKGKMNGLYSPEGKCILNVEYINITQESIYNIPEWKWGTYLKIQASNGLYGFYHRKKLFEPKFEEIYMLEYSATDLLIIKNGLKGIYSSAGEIILKPECSDINILLIKENLGKKIREQPDVYVLKKDELYGFYFFKKNKKLIEPEFTTYTHLVSSKQSWGYRIIAEKAETKVVFNRFGCVMN